MQIAVLGALVLLSIARIHDEAKHMTCAYWDWRLRHNIHSFDPAVGSEKGELYTTLVAKVSPASCRVDIDGTGSTVAHRCCESML